MTDDDEPSDVPAESEDLQVFLISVCEIAQRQALTCRYLMHVIRMLIVRYLFSTRLL